MAVYNGESFLAPAIESILAQTFSDFNFIIVDDGSEDGSRDLIASYKDQRITLIENPENIGLTGSLNRGLGAAKSEFVARQDADDVSMPDRFERQVEFLDSNPQVILLGTQAILMNVYGKDQSRASYVEKPVSRDGILWQFIFDNPFIHTSVMFRLHHVRDCLGGYDDKCVIGQDYDLWSRVALRYPVANLGVPLVRSRIHSDSVMANYSPEKVLTIVPALERCLRGFIETSEVPEQWPDMWLRIRNQHIMAPPPPIRARLLRSLEGSMRASWSHTLWQQATVRYERTWPDDS